MIAVAVHLVVLVVRVFVSWVAVVFVVAAARMVLGTVAAAAAAVDVAVVVVLHCYSFHSVYMELLLHWVGMMCMVLVTVVVRDHVRQAHQIEADSQLYMHISHVAGITTSNGSTSNAMCT